MSRVSQLIFRCMSAISFDNQYNNDQNALTCVSTNTLLLEKVSKIIQRQTVFFPEKRGNRIFSGSENPRAGRKHLHSLVMMGHGNIFLSRQYKRFIVLPFPSRLNSIHDVFQATDCPGAIRNATTQESKRGSDLRKYGECGAMGPTVTRMALIAGGSYESGSIVWQALRPRRLLLCRGWRVETRDDGAGMKCRQAFLGKNHLTLH